MELKPIKIQSNIFKIPINDGEFIEINLNNNDFISNLQKLKKLTTEEYPKFNSGSTDKDFENLSLFCHEMSCLIELMFGCGTVYRIFGISNPTIDVLADFMEQISPYLELAMKQIQDKIEKRYNAYEKRAETRELRK